VQQGAEPHTTPDFKGVSRTTLKLYDRLSGQQAPAEAAQAVVSVFLSFVPFQILKRKKRYVETFVWCGIFP
jgi:hypothetical protein